MRLNILNPFAFVLMPFAEKFDEVYQRGIRRACDEAGVECERVDEQYFTNSIVERVYEQIARADVIIADMTGKNPNVYYEAGYARALRKPIIFLSQDGDIPFDLKHYPHILYGSDVKLLRAKLREHIVRSLSQPDVTAIPSSALEFCIVNKQTSMCLDVARAPDDHPYAARESVLNGADTQIWRLYPVGGGYYRVVCTATGRCLSVDGNDRNNGARIIQWDYFAGAGQHWSIRPTRDGSHELRNQLSDKCIEVPDPSRGPTVSIGQWTWHGADRQTWWFMIPTIVEAAAGVRPVPTPA